MDSLISSFRKKFLASNDLKKEISDKYKLVSKKTITDLYYLKDKEISNTLFRKRNDLWQIKFYEKLLFHNKSYILSGKNAVISYVDNNFKSLYDKDKSTLDIEKLLEINNFKINVGINYTSSIFEVDEHSKINVDETNFDYSTIQIISSNQSNTRKLVEELDLCDPAIKPKLQVFLEKNV